MSTRSRKVSNPPVDREQPPEPSGQQPPPQPLSRFSLQHTWVRLVLLALAYTLLNAFKPVVIDDTAYIYYARQIAQHPDDPYGFSFVWYGQVDPANHILAPPVFLYWLGLGIRIFGENPVLWKLWLFPVCLLFVTAIQRLTRRVAHDLCWPLTILIVFSPVFVPSLNLMLDVPALSMSLTALNVFLSAIDRKSWWRALAAGVIAGLAMQTKYTAVTIPVAMGLWALVRVRPWPEWFQLMVTGLVAAAVFIAWERYTLHRYGESHFWYSYRGGSGRSWSQWWEQKRDIAPGLLGQMGSMSPALVLLGLAALGFSRRTLLIVGGTMLAGFGVLCLGSISLGADIVPSPVLFGSPQPLAYYWRPPFSEAFFGLVAIALWLLTMAAIWVLARGWLAWTEMPQPESSRWIRHRIDVWLILWLMLELCGYFMLTPFPAVRRIMAVFLVFSLLLGRLASLTCHSPERRRLVWGIVCYGMALMLLYQVTDWSHGRFQERGAVMARSWIDDHRNDPIPEHDGLAEEAIPDPNAATIWYSGHWGFKFYADREGMKEVILYRDPKIQYKGPQQTRFRKGDWFVVPDGRVFQAGVKREYMVEVAHLILRDGWPLRTLVNYYSGGVAIENAERASGLEVKVFRITEDFTPEAGPGGFPLD